MVPSLAMVLISVAAFSVVSFRLAKQRAAPGTDFEQLKSFIYVGAAALVILAVAVLLVGAVADASGRAEGLAMFGFFSYPIYLLAAIAIDKLTRPG
jgi:hypothetical protein